MSTAHHAVPVAFIDGVAHPITDAQFALARAGRPMGPIAGLNAIFAQPRASVPSVPLRRPHPTASAPAPAPASPTSRKESTMTEADRITAAVAQARGRLPNLPGDYGPRAIAAGKTLSDVQADLMAQMSTAPRERGKQLMKAECERQGLFKGSRAEALSASAGGTVSGRNLMADLVRRQGGTPNL